VAHPGGTVSPLLIALLGVMLLPLFIGTWRASLIGLGLQGLLMASLASQMFDEPRSLNDWITLTDLVLVRGLGAPAALYVVLRAQRAPDRNDVIPPNLLSWTFALVGVLLAFSFARSMVAHEGEEQTLVAVAASGLFLGLLVLATQARPFGQMIGALRLENAIALFELGGARHHPLGVQLGQIAVVIATVALYQWFLRTLGDREPPPTGPTAVSL
jgi:hydrogenase-4 membrane subunit HyfE